MNMKMNFELHLGDCRESMRKLAENSVDSIVTDPPYHLTTGKKGGSGEASVNLDSPYGRARVTTGFMGMTWDGGDIAQSVEMWREALRVLKPGGHLLAFSGSRTYHRMVCAIEDAGFEIRDQIMWVYGSGFPKSLDVSKAIDKATGAKRKLTRAGTVQRDGYGGDWDTGSSSSTRPRFDTPATDAARQWQGWGTALKPAHEPIVVARKPLVGTVAANVLAHGTGALNIDGCRVAGVVTTNPQRRGAGNISTDGRAGQDDTGLDRVSDTGRWPANLIHDGSEEVVALFPAQAGAAAPVKGTEASSASEGRVTGERDRVPGAFHADKGSAARFFYCAKASKSDRSPDNNHPTVKPTELMRYLCRLVTPPGGLVLDPFAGSGSTGKAALLEGFRFIGCELSPDYAGIAHARIMGAALGGFA